MLSLSDFTAIPLGESEHRELAEYDGQVVLVVNVASKCGYTKQYAGLEELYQKYRDRGFVILAFPCNQFGGQEPGDSEQIAEFCRLTYGVSFPVFEKVKVNGAESHPLFEWLRGQKSGIFGPIDGGRIKWNFTKFLLGRKGQVLGRYASKVTPAELEAEIEKALAEPLESAESDQS